MYRIVLFFAVIFFAGKTLFAQARPALFETAFFKNASARRDTATIFFTTVDIGTLTSETGRLIACDPIVMGDARPYIQQFPVGRFPVQLAIAKYRGDERVASSRIRFSDSPVVRWEFARDSGQRQLSIFGDSTYGFSIDAPAAVFIDARANAAFAALYRADNDLFERAFTDEMAKHDHGGWEYGDYHFQGHNIISFTPGIGDGLLGAEL